MNALPVQEYARRYLDLGYSLVAFSRAEGKGPRETDWGHRRFHVADLAADSSIGLVAGPSRTAVLDADDLGLTRQVLEALGLDLDELMNAAPTWHGNPLRRKLVFALPADVKAPGVRKLALPKKAGVRSTPHTVFELRGTSDPHKQVQDVLPPSVHPDTKLPYRWITPLVPRDQLPPLPRQLADVWANWTQWQPALLSLCGEEVAAPRPRPPGSDRDPDTAQLIADYNATVTVETVLERNGFEPRGKRWLRPGSTTGQPGVVQLQPGVVYAHDGSPLSDGKLHDAFDCMRLLEQEGDWAKAFDEARAVLGPERDFAGCDPGPETRADWADIRGGSSDDVPYIPVPSTPDGMLYGPIGRWAQEATANSEASPAAVYLAFITYVAACLGDQVSLRFGDKTQRPSIFFLHVGRSSRGRKGTALDPVERLHDQLSATDKVAAELAASNSGVRPQAVAPWSHTGGLSTREGLAYQLRDPVIKRNPQTGVDVVEDEGVADKRAFIVESEFENVLAQSKREGNTLSSALRDCWDGRDLKPLTKSNRTYATAPRVSLVAQVTPSDLDRLLEERAITNGFLNRFVVVFAERSKLVPWPESTPDDQVIQWAKELYGAVQWARAQTTPITVSPTAQARYSKLYVSDWAHDGEPELISTLLQRAPTYALRLAMLFAAIEERPAIIAEDIDAANHVINLWRSSVRYLWQRQASLGSGRTEKLKAHAAKVITFLEGRGGRASRTELLHICFRRNLSAAQLNQVLQHMQLATHPMILVEEEAKVGENAAQRKTVVVRI